MGPAPGHQILCVRCAPLKHRRRKRKPRHRVTSSPTTCQWTRGGASRRIAGPPPQRPCGSGARLVPRPAEQVTLWAAPRPSISRPAAAEWRARWPGVSSGGGTRRGGQSRGAGTPAAQGPPRIGRPPQHVTVGAGLQLGSSARVPAASKLVAELSERWSQVRDAQVAGRAGQGACAAGKEAVSAQVGTGCVA